MKKKEVKLRFSEPVWKDEADEWLDEHYPEEEEKENGEEK